jgi:hypothetical protein
MRTIIKIFLLSILLTSWLGAENFSEMSTQELIAIIGYVKDRDIDKFISELETRIPSMTPAEKKQINNYEARLKKSK